MSDTRETRNFNESDATFLSKANSITIALASHLDRFTTFDAMKFNEEYVASLREKLLSLEESVSDTVVRAISSQKTEAVKIILLTAVDEMQFAKYFVRKVCDNKRADMNVFGYNKLGTYRSSPGKMLFLFEEFVSTVQERSSELLSVGYPAFKLHQLEKLYREFETTVSDQRQYKRERKGITALRVQHLNEIYREMKFIEEVAVKYVFRKEPEMQGLFRLAQ